MYIQQCRWTLARKELSVRSIEIYLLFVVMLAPVPTPWADKPKSGEISPVQSSAVDTANEVFPPGAIKSCITVGFAEGSAQHRGCARDFMLTAATGPKTATAPFDRRMRVARGVNLGELCASYYADGSRAARLSVPCPVA